MNPDEPDEFGKSYDDYKATSDMFSDELEEALKVRSDRSAWNGLKMGGMPRTPWDIAQMAWIFFRAGVSFAITAGFAELTEKGSAAVGAPVEDNVVPLHPNGASDG